MDTTTLLIIIVVLLFRRLVWPRALVLVSLSTISARSSHWGSVMMGPGSESPSSKAVRAIR